MFVKKNNKKWISNWLKNSLVVNNLFANEKLEIVDLNGKSIYKSNVAADGSVEITLPETLSAGIYFLKVQGNSEEIVIKLVKN